MPHKENIEEWKTEIHTRYLNYLKTSFYFKNAGLRTTFDVALQERELMKGAFPEPAHGFRKGINARTLAQKYFPEKYNGILPALLDNQLYDHQERAIQQIHNDKNNVVVATGTASGKTEGFLYPILFELYQQHLEGKLSEPGVRTLILYPMNALANDQRRRLGDICQDLENSDSDFKPTFGQYIGATPENEHNRWRNANAHEENRLSGELIFREEMRETPPHILMTNYSMLEYLLIRPEDSKLFDDGRGSHWQFIVLDEAHQYRGAKGMEMGMLVRRLKQRLRDGGRGEQPFRCIATSATISSSEGEEDKKTVAEFSHTLFGEKFTAENVIFGQKEKSDNSSPQRFHLFLSALEGAFLSHKDGEDRIILNRRTESGDENSESKHMALEIALCRECGQHYYVGREDDGYLIEAIRDPSQSDFGVKFYLPLDKDADIENACYLCRQCGKLSTENPACECNASIAVKKCDNHAKHLDRIKQCEICNYEGSGDPVQEIVRGSDGPNSVIATALHTLLSKNNKNKILSFADSRQEAAFFAWYAQYSYEKIRDRNFIFRALKKSAIDEEGLSLNDLKSRLQKILGGEGIFQPNDSGETQRRRSLQIICRELVTDEQRNSLEGVGLVKWSIRIPEDFELPKIWFQDPWNFTVEEGRELLNFLLNTLRYKQAMELPDGSPPSAEVFEWSQRAVTAGTGGGTHTFAWSGPQSDVVKYFLFNLLANSPLSPQEKLDHGKKLLDHLWDSIADHRSIVTDEHSLLVRANINGTFRLNSAWLRVNLPSPGECFECDTCARLSFYNIRTVCPRNRCPGRLVNADWEKLKQNHYYFLYKDKDMPPKLRAEEHTAQVHSEEAQIRQQEFIDGKIDLLSSSTTFEVGVDLGDLEVAFLRNVPPETFNYTQRVGRVGRSETSGLAVTYCRRNPHDLYHFADPVARILEGEIHPPQLRLHNEKIIIRHIAAMAFSAFFKANKERFENVESLIGPDWKNSRATSDVRKFLEHNTVIQDSLRAVVPEDVHEKVGLHNNEWIEKIAGNDSQYAKAEQEVCEDYNRMHTKREEYKTQNKLSPASRIDARMKTIANEKSLNFLSRKAIIPKYGFPVDVVELDTRPYATKGAHKISLQRDLSQAIAEYAPGAKVVANKKEWESCGVRVVHGKELEVKNYVYSPGREFTKWSEDDQSPTDSHSSKKYLWPQFGFVTELFKQPKEPKGRARRMYTTRPFFEGFVQEKRESRNSFGIKITPAQRGRMVVLCEGKNGGGFYICRRCGSGSIERKSAHKSPEGSECGGMLELLSLGHEFETDVVRLQFPNLNDQWEAYSLAYAILLGISQTLNVPDTDINTTITAGDTQNEIAIVLYDNVPGGAGLVASLEKTEILKIVLAEAKKRVGGDCGCTESCYGCIRSYRNQFAHPYLQRITALQFLENALEKVTADSA